MVAVWVEFVLELTTDWVELSTTVAHVPQALEAQGVGVETATQLEHGAGTHCCPQHAGAGAQRREIRCHRCCRANASSLTNRMAPTNATDKNNRIITETFLKCLCQIGAHPTGTN